MQSYGDDNEFGGSPNASSDDDQNEPMDEIEEGEAEGDVEAEVEEEEEEEEIDNGADEDVAEDEQPFTQGQESQNYYSESHARVAEKQPTRLAGSGASSSDLNEGSNIREDGSASAPTSQPRPTVLLTSPSPQRTAAAFSATSIEHPQVRFEALSAPVYDIVPTIAAPHSTSINAIAATPDLRWVFSGGADGYIRKFNWVETANGKVMLTVAQRHPFVDSVTKAGVLTSYWENEEPQPKQSEDGQTLSPVYSLAVHNQGLWLLSGLESGGINLQSVRHDEGKRISCLKKHTSAVSVLNLAEDERSVLSGSWDKTVLDWDLNTGQVKRSFEGSGGQISALEMRPLSELPVPETVVDQPLTNGTFSSNSAGKTRPNGVLSNGITYDSQVNSNQENGNDDALGSPADSLFGGNDADSLFGDNDDENTGAPSAGNFAEDDDDEFSRAIANGIQQQENEDADGDGDIDMLNPNLLADIPHTNGLTESDEKLLISDGLDRSSQPLVDTDTAPLSNGLPHAEDLEAIDNKDEPAGAGVNAIPTAESTFLAASFDGTLRVWDRRKPTPVAKISPRNVPPWCMGACWSQDGNFIYAGRRNGTVEEFSLHHGLRGVERTFKFPNGSGAVSAVRAMPNGRHLICASYDILRLYDLHQQQTFQHSTVPFLIVPGHRTGVVSQLYIDPTCKFMISTAGNRGWDGTSTEVLLGYEIGIGI
ncbi:Transcription factor spt8 [Xylographa trunciseda]|nr:Transcription factor spt8 [Xylographa trunciseda]